QDLSARSTTEPTFVFCLGRAATIIFAQPITGRPFPCALVGRSRSGHPMAKNFILHTIPTKLPPAKLYLDDITEIWQILTESCDEPRTSVIVGKAQCDSLKDLPEMGGRSTHLLMEISSPGKHHTLAITPSATTIHIHETGDQVMAWSKYVKVDAI